MPSSIVLAAVLRPQFAWAAETSGAEPAARAPPSAYVVVVAATTLAYRPSGGHLAGPQSDLSPTVGFGWFLSETVSVELDLGPTLVHGSYASLSLMPSAVWAFHPNFYGAARVMVPVDPETNIGIFPGLGATYAFASGIAPLVEVDVGTFVGRGKPDLGVVLSGGFLYSF